MRIVMMGTGPFAVPTFVDLLESPHDVVALVTRPVPPATGRAKQTAVPNPMRDEAERRGVPVFAPASVNSPEAAEFLRRQNADLFVVCDYGQILSREALSLARLGGINLHGSLLPRHRGAAPVQWTILAGDDVAGVTVIHMTPKLDGGPSLAKRSTPIGSEETAGELEVRLSKIGVDAVREALATLATWDGTSPIGELQDSALATRAPRLSKQDGAMDWRQSAATLALRIRALRPWPGSYTTLPQGDAEPLRVIVTKAVAVASPNPTAAPGTIFPVAAGEMLVACGAGDALRIDELQPAGKRPMSAGEFLRGRKLEPDARFN